MLGGLFVAIRPRYIGLKNTWFHSSDASLQRAVRLGVLGAFALIIPNLVYLGVTESLSQFKGSTGAVSYIIELINFTLLSILFFSSSIHSLHSLFLSKDNDLLLAAPLKPLRLFAGKFLETTIASSWVMALFYLPTMYAVGSAFGGKISFYIFTVLDLIPLIIVPISLGFIASILFVRIYPARRVKEIFIGSSLIFVILLHFSLRGHELLLATIQSDLPSLMNMQNAGEISFTPPNSSLGILSIPLESALNGNTLFSLNITVILCAFAGICILSAYRCFYDLYYRLYSSDTLSHGTLSFRTRRSLRHSSSTRSLFQAIIFKDYRLFLRDVTQPVQLMLFILMGLVVILGLKASASIGATIRETHRWWDDLVLIFNIGLHALICVLFSARFLFPSISAEGEAQWILRAAPISTLSLLKVKFLANLLPASVILITLLIAGCLVSDLNPSYIMIAAIAGLLNIYCISGISIGCGAYFSNMRYEHMGQVTAGLGSFFFMLIALVVVPWNGFLALFCALCISILIEIRDIWIISTLALSILSILHISTVRYFLKKGQEQLEED